MNEKENSRMDQNMREFFVSRIRAGFIKINNIYVTGIEPIVEYESCEKYNEAFEQARTEGSATLEENLRSMIISGTWSAKNEETLEKILPEHIDKWKVSIYESYFRSLTKESFRKYLDTARGEQNKLYSIKHMYDAYTAEGIATFAKNLHLFMNSCFDRNGKMVNWDDMDPVVEMTNYQNAVLEQSFLRELSRTSPWSSYWMIHKKSGIPIFHSKHLNIEQNVMIQWTSLYDSVHEANDCPIDEIIEDDDALDGWLIINRKKREGEKNKTLLDTLSDKVGNASEIFMVAETPEDAARIRSLNDQRANSVVNNRINQVRKRGIIQDQDFADQKERIIMEANQMNSKSINGARG